VSPDEFLAIFFDRFLSLNTDRDSVISSLQIVDDWCRLHPPDKFLERYESAIAQPIDD
jgi:hypothetical protein